MCGYRHCACRDCFETIVGNPGDLCDGCDTAGCGVDGGECSRPDAYGCESLIRLSTADLDGFEIATMAGDTLQVTDPEQFPGLAGHFGWLKDQIPGDCRHDLTDGSADCPECGRTAVQFIASATRFLECSEGETIQDPGYFC